VAKKKNNRKKKKPAQQFVKLKPESYIRKHARKVSVYECLIRDDWRETRFSPVVVTRKKKNEELVLGTYIVDMQCLGVKDTSYSHAMDIWDYRTYIENMEEGMYLKFVKIDPTLCFNIIYGAVEFAEDCGFQPHKDFAITKYILDDRRTVEHLVVPLGGEDGKPLFVSGPYDNTEKILATLRKNKGEGNFDYMAEINPDDIIFPDNVSNRVSVLGEFFPEKLIDEKIDSLPTEEEQRVLGFQLQIATNIMVAGNGDLEFIKQQYEEDEEFYEAILNETLMQMEEDSPLEELDLTIKEYEGIREHVLWVLEKIIALDGPSFLWDKAYKPELISPTPEELFNYTDEELAAYEKAKVFYMTNAVKDKYVLGMYLTNFTATYRLGELGQKDIQEKVLAEYLNELKENVFRDKWDAEMEEYCREIGQRNLEKLSSMSDDEKK